MHIPTPHAACSRAIFRYRVMTVLQSYLNIHSFWLFPSKIHSTVHRMQQDSVAEPIPETHGVQPQCVTTGVAKVAWVGVKEKFSHTFPG